MGADNHKLNNQFRDKTARANRDLLIERRAEREAEEKDLLIDSLKRQLVERNEKLNALRENGGGEKSELKALNKELKLEKTKVGACRSQV